MHEFQTGRTSTASTVAEQSAGGASSAPTGLASSIAAPAKASKNYNLQFIQGVAGDEFYITMQCGIQAEAAKLGVSVKTQGAQKFDPTLQKPILDSVVAAKPDAILIAPTDVTAMQAPLNAAAQSGIKIVLVDTTVKDPSIAVSAIASDNEGGGKAAFDAIKQLNPNGGKVMIMSVDPGISTTDARAKGFEEAVKADSKFQYLGIQYSHNDPATAANLIGSALQKDPTWLECSLPTVLRRRHRHRRTPVWQAGAGQDCWLRRRPEPGEGSQGWNGSGSGGAAAGNNWAVRRRRCCDRP